MVSDNAREMSISACGRVNYSKISLKAWTLAPLGRGTWWMPETGSLASAWPHAQGPLSRSWFPVHSQGWCGRWVGTTKVFSSSRVAFSLNVLPEPPSSCPSDSSEVQKPMLFPGAGEEIRCVYTCPRRTQHTVLPQWTVDS